MKKVCLSILLLSMLLLIVNISFAEPVPRYNTSSVGKTGHTNIAVVGLNQDGTDGLADTGIPGYIEMTSCKGDVYYLYIGYDGALRIASESAVGYGASPAIVGWADASAPLVGAQNILSN